MISTGNDVVALKAIDIARTQQRNFYTKIISASEEELFHQQAPGKIDLVHFVWLLWSIKESVYKFLQRITPELVFSPTRTVISQLKLPANLTAAFDGQTDGWDFDDDEVYKATVSFEGNTLYSRSIIGEEFILSVVNNEDNFEDTRWGIGRTDSAELSDQSEAVRVLLIDQLRKLFPGDHLQIDKTPQGYPILLRNGVETAIPVSLAHHDHYVAYSFVYGK
jgi:phosphopantetheinyl transferase (holo-ACP synthase)